MKTIALRIALTVMFAALVSCGGGGGVASIASPIAQAPYPAVDVFGIDQSRNAKTDADEAPIPPRLAAEQADRSGGLSELLTQGGEGLKLLAKRSEVRAISTNPRLFAYLQATLKIASIPNADPFPGEKIAANVFMPYFIGPGNLKYGVYASNLAYDAKRDRLYVPTNGGGIGVLKNASVATGEVQLQVYWIPTGMDTLGSVFLDVENDTLWFVSSTGANAGTIAVVRLNSVSNIEINSRSTINDRRMAPSDFMTVWHMRALTFAAGFAIDVKRSLFYMENGAVFDLNTITPTPMTGSGYSGSFPLDTAKAYNTVPNRVFFDGLKFLTSVALDTSKDRLYYVDTFRKQLIILDNASTATNSTAPLVMNLPGTVASYSSLAIDTKNDRLYIGGAANDAYIINNASAINSASTLPASYLFADVNPPIATSQVWGIAIPQY